MACVHASLCVGVTEIGWGGADEDTLSVASGIIEEVLVAGYPGAGRRTLLCVRVGVGAGWADLEALAAVAE